MASFKSITSLLLLCAFLAISFQASQAQYYYSPSVYPAYRTAYYAPAYYQPQYVYPSYAYAYGSNKRAEGPADGPQKAAFDPAGLKVQAKLTNNQ